MRHSWVTKHTKHTRDALMPFTTADGVRIFPFKCEEGWGADIGDNKEESPTKIYGST